LIRFIRKFIFSFNIIAIFLLLASYASVYVNPHEYWYFALLGLAFPFIFFINLAFVVFWFFQFNIKMVYGILAIIIGYSFIPRNFQFFKKSNITDEKTIEICSYNVGLFGYFEGKWLVDETIVELEKNPADIICFQEFLNLKSDTSSTIDTFLKTTKFKYYYFEKLKDGRKRGEYGMLILSKFPIKNKGLVQFNQYTGNMCVFCDVIINGELSRVYNVHLQSFRFKKNDYQFINKITDSKVEKIDASKNLLRKIKHAYSIRANQVEVLTQFISNSNLPYFILGDFNDPPMSYSYQKLSNNMKDAFIENGFGMGKTYIGLMPNFRIDYILYPEKYSGISYSTKKLGSDHQMLRTKIFFNKDI